MFKAMISALMVSGVVLSGAAFAADATAPTQVQSHAARPAVAEKSAVEKVHHTAAKTVKTEKQQAAAVPAQAPMKAN